MPARTRNQLRSAREGSATPRQVVLRVRVSSKDQEEAGFSIPAQLRLLREYASNHGFAIREEFVDAETSQTGNADGYRSRVGCRIHGCIVFRLSWLSALWF